ncbi:MAG: tetratricopeptide repeat protein, partial [Candidatus Thorarchaeota archaeon]
LEFYQLKIGILLDNDQYQIVLNLIDEMLDKFPKQEIDLKLKKAMVLKNLRQIDRGLEIINDLIEHNPKEESLLSYKAYWMQYLDEENEAIEIMQDLIDKNPSNSMYHDTYGEILMNFKKYSKATTEFLKTIDLEPGGWFIYQTYVKLGICYKELEDYESAVTFLNKGISLAKTSHADSKSKKNWLSIANLFLEQISYENQDFQ